MKTPTRTALAALAMFACTTPAEPRASLIDQPSVIAVAIDPPEAKPGHDVRARVIVATPDGPGDAGDAAWSLCTSPRPVTDNNAVAGACLNDGVTAIGDGASVTATLSTDACALFGPDPPPGGFRPRDPDPTGGYYQPLRVDVADATSFGMARIFCHLANAPLDAAQRYDTDYTFNTAPHPDPIQVGEVHAGDTVDLVVRWPDETREHYLRYDVATQTLDEALENLTVSWYVTGGELQLDRTVGLGTGAIARWTAPDRGPAHVWAVVRDDRGAVGVSDVAVDVIP